MFRCYFCQKITPPKTTRHSVVIETREKHYATRRREPKRGRFRDREDSVQDRGGKGVEITREVDACPECAAKQHEVTNIAVTPPQDAVVQTEDNASQDTATQDAQS